MQKTILTVSLFCVATVFAFAANPPSKSNNTSKPITMDRQMFLDKVFDYSINPQTDEWAYKGDRPAIIDFWAPWCGPCRQVAPILDELAAEYGDKIYIYKVNVDNEQELAGAFGIRTIPMFLFIPMKGTPYFAKGALPKVSFRKAIDELLISSGK